MSSCGVHMGSYGRLIGSDGHERFEPAGQTGSQGHPKPQFHLEQVGFGPLRSSPSPSHSPFPPFWRRLLPGIPARGLADIVPCFTSQTRVFCDEKIER